MTLLIRFSWLSLLVAALVVSPAMPAMAEEEAEEGAEEEPEPEPQPRDIDQVQIQVWISETNEDGLRDMGVNLDYTRFVREVEQSGAIERIATSVFDPQDPDHRVTLPAPGERTPLRPDQEGTLADGIQTQRGAGMTFSIIDSGRGTIDGVFRSMDRRVDVDLISKPELLVANEHTAAIHAGGEVPFQSVEYDGAEPRLNVEWRDIGVNLDLQPTILSEDMVQVNIQELNVSDVARIDNIRGMDLPVFSERSQTGEVMVPSGQTLVIGGLSSRVVRNTERRVPIVGNIPLVGIPFRGREAESENTHLLIFVSPTIVDLRDLQPEAVSALNFWREERWRHMDRIDQEIRVLEHDM